LDFLSQKESRGGGVCLSISHSSWSLRGEETLSGFGAGQRESADKRILWRTLSSSTKAVESASVGASSSLKICQILDWNGFFA
jgi:hypothetical protein